MVSCGHFGLAAVLIGLAATSAAAEWSAAGGTLLHPNAAQLTGAIDAATSVVISCADRTLNLAFTTRAANVHPPAASGEGTLRIIPDAGNWSWLNVAYRHEGGALVVETSEEKVRATVDQIIGAKATITYILDFVGGQGEVRWVGDATKSTAAGRAFLEICYERATDVPIAIAPAEPPLEQPAPSQQPSITATQPSGTTQFGSPGAPASTVVAAADPTPQAVSEPELLEATKTWQIEFAKENGEVSFHLTALTLDGDGKFSLACVDKNLAVILQVMDPRLFPANVAARALLDGTVFIGDRAFELHLYYGDRLTVGLNEPNNRQILAGLEASGPGLMVLSISSDDLGKAPRAWEISLDNAASQAAIFAPTCPD